MSNQYSAKDVYEQGKGDDYQISNNYEGDLDNAIATPINQDTANDDVETKEGELTSTGQQPDFITVTEYVDQKE
uniref:DUF4025 domain-containing protein n=1 Tax=Panagrolaimus superbus TaxID=310955 RepID=A0A914XWM7_9BILA